MGRVYTYVIFFVGLTILMQLAGFGELGSGVLDQLGLSPGIISGTEDFSLSDSSFWLKILGLLAAAAVGGIAIGFITKASTENYVVGIPMTAVLILFADVAVGLINSSSNYDPWAKGLLYITIIPLAVGFVFSLAEWFRGNT